MAEAELPIEAPQDPAAWAGSYAFVDLETTGCDPARDRIIEIAIAAVDDGRVVDVWSRLIHPGARVPATGQQLTGIDPNELSQAPRFEALAEEIAERLRGCTLVAHNARFDHAFLRNALPSAVGPHWRQPMRARPGARARIASGLRPPAGRRLRRAPLRQHTAGVSFLRARSPPSANVFVV